MSGQARILISEELVKQFLDFPQGWSIQSAYVQQGYVGGPKELALIVEGDSIVSRDVPVDMIGTFHAKTFDDKDGRWQQGHWEIYR